MNVPVRDAIRALWAAARPAQDYVIDDDIPRDLKVTLNFYDAPFEQALQSIADGVQLNVKLNANTYSFSRAESPPVVVKLAARGGKLTWKLANADPRDVLTQVLGLFDKTYDVDLNADPTDELKAFARRAALKLKEGPPGPPGSDVASVVREDAQRYLKPPARPSGTPRISTEGSDLAFVDAMDTLSTAGGFLWFLRGEKYIFRNTIAADKVRDIFRQEGILDVVQK